MAPEEYKVGTLVEHPKRPEWGPGKILAVTVGALALACVLVLTTPSWASVVLGTMDEPWRQVILKASFFIFASEWRETDWLNVVMGLLGVGAAAWTCWRAGCARFAAREPHWSFSVKAAA